MSRYVIILVTLQIKMRIMQDFKNISAYKEGLKEKILSTAMAAFYKNGIRAVKMNDIANALSISKRTLYELYKNKEDLLFEGIRRYHQLRHDEMRNFASGDVSVMDIVLHSFKLEIEDFNFANPAFFSDLLRYPRILEYFEEDKKNDQKQFMSFLQRGIDEGYFRGDLNYDLVVSILELQHKHIMMSQLYQRFSMKEICYNLLFVSLRGICTSKGIAVLDAFLGESKPQGTQTGQAAVCLR